MFESDTICGFIDNAVSWLIKNHNPSEDGSSTGNVISLYQQLKSQIGDVRFTRSRARHIGEKIVKIAGDLDEGYDVSSKIEELADEINCWK